MLRQTDVHVLLANETLFYSNTLYDSILHQSLSQGNVATGRQGTRPSSYILLRILRSPTVESISPLFGPRARHDNDFPLRLSSVISLPF